MTTAMVLGAGFGTRLSPLTDELAKPLMPVGDRPMVAHVVAALRDAGIGRVVINTHHLGGPFAAEIAVIDPTLQVVHEPEILGTAGGVTNAAPWLGDGAVLIWNGDILAPSLDVRALVARREQAAFEALWVVERLPRGAGSVGLDEAGNVVRLRGELFGGEAVGGDFLGIQVMGPKLRSTLPARGCLVENVALPLLRAGGQIASFGYAGAWDDVGRPAALLAANLRWLDRRGLPAWSEADARIAPGVALVRSVVGAGAVVRGSGELRECVVFPGAEVTAPCARTLVSRRAHVEVSVV